MDNCNNVVELSGVLNIRLASLQSDPPNRFRQKEINFDMQYMIKISDWSEYILNLSTVIVFFDKYLK